jgi:16S rRNA processing protein RimM
MTEQTPPPNDTLLIGQIVAPFGTRGQMKVRSYTDHVQHLIQRIRTVYVGPERREYTITHVFEHKPGLLVLSLAGVASRDDAAALRGTEVAILEHEAAPLEQDEYFIHQLYGLLVVTEQGEEIGRVKEVLSTRANDVAIVPRLGKTDALIPIIRDVVQELNITAGRIVIRPMEGLL